MNMAICMYFVVFNSALTVLCSINAVSVYLVPYQSYKRADWSLFPRFHLQTQPPALVWPRPGAHASLSEPVQRKTSLFSIEDPC